MEKAQNNYSIEINVTRNGYAIRVGSSSSTYVAHSLKEVLDILDAKLAIPNDK